MFVWANMCKVEQLFNFLNQREIGCRLIEQNKQRFRLTKMIVGRIAL